MRLALKVMSSVLLLVFLGSFTQLTAQNTSGSTIAGFDPSNTSLCPTSGYTTVTGVYNTGTIQSGYCRIPVTWNNNVVFPSNYAINCTVETGGGGLGYIFNPTIDYTTKTATGFTLVVNFWVNNIEISNDGNVPPGAIDLGHPSSGAQDWYVFGRTTDGARRQPIGLNELAHMAVDCFGNNS